MNDKKDLLQVKSYLENIYNNIDIEKNIKLFQNVVWDESKDFPEFYKEYITIAGTDNNGKANINNNSLISDSNKLEKLEKLAIKYENNEEFKKFENAVAYNVYYERPVSKLPQDIQNRINNLPIEAKQIIMSTYVQYGEGTNRIKQAFNAIDNDYMALSYIISKKDPYSSRKVIEFDILNKEYDIKN